MKTLQFFLLAIWYLSAPPGYSIANETAVSNGLDLKSNTLYQEGIKAYENGAFRVAITHWEKGLKRLSSSDNWKRRIMILSKLASAYQNLGMKRLTEDSLNSALMIANEFQSEAHIRLIKRQLGVAYTYTLDHKKAEQLLQESLEIARTENDRQGILVGLLNMGNLKFVQKNYSEALDRYQDCLSFVDTLNTSILATKVFVNTAMSAIMNEQFKLGLEFNDKAQKNLNTLTPSFETATLFVSTGKNYQALASAMPSRNKELLIKSYETYTSSIDTANAIGDTKSLSYAYGFISQLYELELNFKDALQLARKAVFHAQNNNLPDALYQWQWQAASLLRKLGKDKDAIRSYANAVETLETIRHDIAISYSNQASQLSFRTGIKSLFYEYADLLLKYSESMSTKEEASHYLYKARKTIEQLKSAEIEDYLSDSCVNIGLKQRQEIDVLTSDTAVIYTISLDDRLELLISIADSIYRFTIPIAKPKLVSETKNLRMLLEKRPLHEYLTSAQQLYKWLMTPIYNLLISHNITTLVFIPDGPLRMIPFASLHNGKGFLIDEFAIVISPGLTLIAPKPITRQRMEFLANGLSASVQGFPPLDYVDKEINSIGDLFGGKRLINEDFLLNNLESEFLDGQYTIVHIASHGRFDKDPSETYILTFDDRLTLDKLEKIIKPGQFRGAPVELLTLSACETAAGDNRAGLGLAGVAIKSGARSVLATLWTINDQASSKLIIEFYRQLKEDLSISKAQALRRAQLFLMEDVQYNHPCYWSPYLIVGNWL